MIRIVQRQPVAYISNGPAVAGQETMMGASGSFPIDIVLFGMIAAFLVLRLRSILGKREGFERPIADPAARPMGEPPRPVADAPPGPTRALPDPGSATGQVLADMARVEPGFHPARFLDGAEGAFRLIVTAFAAGDRVGLRPLLADDTYRAFEGAISGRETAAETQRTEIHAINSATITAAVLHERHATITVTFVSDQVNLTLGRDGMPVAGTDAVTEITDVWSFERELGSADPAWRLAAARSA